MSSRQSAIIVVMIALITTTTALPNRRQQTMQMALLSQDEGERRCESKSRASGKVEGTAPFRIRNPRERYE